MANLLYRNPLSERYRTGLTRFTEKSFSHVKMESRGPARQTRAFSHGHVLFCFTGFRLRNRRRSHLNYDLRVRLKSRTARNTLRASPTRIFSAKEEKRIRLFGLCVFYEHTFPLVARIFFFWSATFLFDIAIRKQNSILVYSIFKYFPSRRYLHKDRDTF